MIGHLRGTLLEKHPNHVLVETGGVGYEVQIPVSTFSALPDTGSEVRLRIHTHVREDAFSLFGFLTLEEKQLFEKLISVSGIGPKLGITVLSVAPGGRRNRCWRYEVGGTAAERSHRRASPSHGAARARWYGLGPSTPGA